MKIELRSSNFEITEAQEDLIRRKLNKLGYLNEYIVDSHFTIKGDTNKENEKGLFIIKIFVHFNWGVEVSVHDEGYDLYPLIDSSIAKLEEKCRREHEKRKKGHNT